MSEVRPWPYLPVREVRCVKDLTKKIRLFAREGHQVCTVRNSVFLLSLKLGYNQGAECPPH